MDVNDGSDVQMHEVVDSTERQDVSAFLSSPIEEVLEQSTPLKGEGVRRGESATFDYQVRDGPVPKPAKFKALPYSTSQTGLVYDVRMRFHVDPNQEDNDLHPEDPRRIHAIFESFVEAGLAWRPQNDGTGKLGESKVPVSDFYMGRIETRQVTKQEVCLVHTPAHWQWVQDIKHLGDDFLGDGNHQQHPGHKLDSVYISRSTPYCAGLSAGGAIEACRAVMLGKVKNAFAIIRPPGHHAEREDVKGFCFFDNVSIATKVCQREFGDQCRKVLILDWDVHHGNGIQQANYDDPNVLYVSLHVHERGNFYPERSYRDNRPPYGDEYHCGSGAGLGKNVNIPWSQSGMVDADYIYAFQQVVMPIAQEFDPDLVIIAAGFDAAEGDMLGRCHVSPAGYAHMTHMLMSVAQGRVVACLEGGYNLESIAKSATAVARTMTGEPPERMEDTVPSITGVETVKRVLRQHSKFWSCLIPKSARLGARGGVPMDEVVRHYQADTLWKAHSMIPLSVFNQPLSRPFKNQVLATQNYTQPRPLLVILHDPPDVNGESHPVTGKLELHNTFLTDIIKTYVAWATKQGFAVIDVNLPKHKHNPDEDEKREEYEPNDSLDLRAREATSLMSYLWDNYIEFSDATHVVLMGSNIGHGAIINWIKSNEEKAEERVTAAISFVEDVALQSVRSATNDLFAPWYHSISLVFIADNHNFWTLDQKPRKRFGRLNKSHESTISEMLEEHRDTVFDFILGKTKSWTNDEDMSNDIDTAVPQKSRLPPVGNFAISPRPRSTANPSALEVPGPDGRQSNSRTPPVGNFALPPKSKPPGSPLR